MALLPDLEPPSSNVTSETNQKKSRITESIKIANSSLRDKLLFFVAKFLEWTEYIKNLYQDYNKFLPHATIIFLLILVMTANLTQSARASSLYLDFTTINPDEELAVVSQVDEFTPLINNGSSLYDKYLTVQTNADGFATNIAPVASQLTLRADPLPDNTSADTAYFVKNGDTLSGIAMLFNVKTATLKYINNLTSADSIKPGVKLNIPKKGYEVSAAQIAKRDAENAAKNKLAMGSRNTIARDQANRTASVVNGKPGSIRNSYPYGWCTYYVAMRRYVPGSWGNAKSWFSSARNAGYATGRTPAAGAIMVSNESWLGHVAYVDSVNSDGTFTISEMNAKGWGVISSRRVSSSYGKIMGFVY